MKIGSVYRNLRLDLQRSYKEMNRISKPTIIKTDTIHISIQARRSQFANGYEAMNFLTHIKGKEIVPLQAHNNVLEFNPGSYYRLNFNGKTAILIGDKNGSVSMPYENITNDLKAGRDFFSAKNNEDSLFFTEMEKLRRIFGQLTENITGTMLYQEFSNAEQKELLAAVGIKEGFFEVKCGSKSNKFYLQADGAIIPNYQMEGQRRAITERNLFEIGYKKGETINVGGVEYEINERGHALIPQGVAVNDNVERRYNDRLIASMHARVERLRVQSEKINNTNLFEYGFTAGEIIKCAGGVEYKIDETGHVNVPKYTDLMRSERLDRIFNELN